MAGFLVGGGVLIAMYLPSSFSAAAWYTAAMLIVFAGIGKVVAQKVQSEGAVRFS